MWAYAVNTMTIQIYGYVRKEQNSIAYTVDFRYSHRSSGGSNGTGICDISEDKLAFEYNMETEEVSVVVGHNNLRNLLRDLKSIFSMYDKSKDLEFLDLEFEFKKEFSREEILNVLDILTKSEEYLKANRPDIDEHVILESVDSLLAQIESEKKSFETKV